MTAAVLHIVLPGYTAARAMPTLGERVGDFLERVGWATHSKGKWPFKLPTVCIINGEYVLRRNWRRRRIKERDQVTFLSRPLGGDRGGSGKQVLGIVALIAVTAFAFWAGPALAAGLGLAGTIVGSLTYAQLFTSAIAIGGTMLVNTLITPKPGGQNQPGTELPQIYSLLAAGNTGRPFESIPVGYGRLKKFPDYATTPWSEFIGDESYSNILLCEGVGKYQHHELYIDDTILWDSTSGVTPTFDAQVAFYNPGETVALFPADVTTAVEVSGQELPFGTGALEGFGGGTPGEWVGGFIANSAGSSATALALDFALPSGCFNLNPFNGQMSPRTIEFEAEARTVDGAGVPTGPFSQIFFKSYTFSTKQPKRVSEKVAVAPGRYEVRARRTGGPIVPELGFDNIVWVGLRAFLAGDATFTDETTIAIRIKASELTQGSARKFGTRSTRILPVWDGSAFVDQATRNPFWAFLDAATNNIYGAKRPLSKIDFQAVATQAAAADARGDKFDFEFRSAVQIPEAFDTILKVSRARHRWAADVLSVVRDEASPSSRFMLSDREIVRGSLSVGWALNNADSADAVILEYLDEDIWAPAEVQYPPDGAPFFALSPTRVRIDGIVNRDRANDAAAFLWRQSQLRRTTVTLDTEWEGKMLGFGSFIRVQSELPQTWGSSGIITDRTGLLLTLDPAPTWETGEQHYIEIKTKRGRRFGPVKVSRVSDPVALLNAADLALVEADQGMTVGQALERVAGAEDPAFSFGTTDHSARDCLVMSGRFSGDRVSLSLVVDDPQVHNDDIDNPPVLPIAPALRDQPAPQIVGLLAVFRQSVAEPILDVTWAPAPGALYYTAQVSYDDGEHWAPLYEGTESKFSAMVDYAELTVRVQAVGLRKGAWSQVTVAAPTIKVRSDNLIVNILAFDASLKARIAGEFKAAQDRVDAALKILASVVTERDLASYTDKQEVRTELKAATDNLSASIETVQTVAHNVGEAFARQEITVAASLGSLSATVQQTITTVANNFEAFGEYQVTVTAQFGDLSASIEETFLAVATVDGTVAAMASLRLNVGGKVTGYQIINDSITSSFDIETDFFRVGKSGGGGAPFVPVFQVGTVDGDDAVVIGGAIFEDGSLTARMVTTGEFITISAQIADAVIKTAHIDTLQVKTLHIEDSSVTQPYTLESGGALTTSTTDWEDQESIPISVQAPSGTPVVVQVFSSQNLLGGTTSRVVGTKIKIDGGADIAEHQTFAGILPDTLMGFFSFTADGTVQDFTVKTQWLTASLAGNGVQSNSRKILVTVFKK